MALQRLTGGDAYPQERTVVLGSEGPAAMVEVVESGETGAIVHVVEPVLIDPEAFEIQLDELSDVVVPDGLPTDVALTLTRAADGTFTVTAGDEQAVGGLAYRHIQFIAATRWQIQHGLAFDPAGVLAKDTTATIVEPETIIHPLPGVVELTFGAPVAGQAWLS